jgi:MoaA/NifB/PqqE/SkfB family radical SAM enzyme
VAAGLWASVPELAGVPIAGKLTAGLLARPLYLRIETVNACNNKCIICAYRDQTRAKATMPQAIFEKAVRDYAALGGGFLSLTPLVGDIFLDRILIDRLRFLETVPEVTALGVTTNGAMAHRFDDDQLAYVVGRFDRLGLSVYGVSDGEYRQMTGRDTYHLMCEGIRRILRAARGLVSLEFRLLERKTVGDLRRWLVAEILGGDDSLLASGRIVLNSILTDYANWGLYDPQTNPLPGDAQWFSSAYAMDRPQCMIPILCCIVLSNGNVSFCPCDNFDDVPELRLGSIADMSLADLYNSAMTEALWQWKTCGTPEFCRRCSFHLPMSVLAADPALLDDPHRLVGAG